MKDRMLEELSQYEDPTQAKPKSIGDRFAIYAVAGLLLFLICILFFPHMIVNVYPGQAGVVWDRFSGTQVSFVLGEGMHIIAPWNHFYRYDVRMQTTALECEALSQAGLPIRVAATVRYRVTGSPFLNVRNSGYSAENSLGILHERIGPDYKDKVVLPVVEEAIRETVGRYSAEDLYRLQRQRIQDEIIAMIADRRSKEQFADERTVDIIDVLIRNISLPDVVRLAIEKKMAEEQAMLAYDFVLLREEKEAQRKIIEANGIRAFGERVKAIDRSALQWKSIEANLELAKSPNTKVVVIGGPGVLPVLADTK